MHGYGVRQHGGHTHFLECNIYQNKVEESPNYASKPCCTNVCTFFFASLKPFLFTQQCASGMKMKCDRPSRPVFIIWGCGVANLVTS